MEVSDDDYSSRILGDATFPCLASRIKSRKFLNSPAVAPRLTGVEARVHYGGQRKLKIADG